MKTAQLDPYSDDVKRYFETPSCAVPMTSEVATAATGYAEESAAGAAIELLWLADDEQLPLRFRAFGCPHLLAAAEWLCLQHSHRPIDALTEFRAPDCVEKLRIPVAKTGRILLLEDAIQALLGQLGTA